MPRFKVGKCVPYHFFLISNFQCSYFYTLYLHNWHPLSHSVTCGNFEIKMVCQSTIFVILLASFVASTFSQTLRFLGEIEELDNAGFTTLYEHQEYNDPTEKYRYVSFVILVFSHNHQSGTQGWSRRNKLRPLYEKFEIVCFVYIIYRPYRDLHSILHYLIEHFE